MPLRSPPFEKSTSFYVTITGNSKRCKYFNFKTTFSKNKNLFQKTGVMFLVERFEIENTTFPYKASLSEANIKINRMGIT